VRHGRRTGPRDTGKIPRCKSSRRPFLYRRSRVAATPTEGCVRALMSLDQSTEWIRQALLLALMVAAPVLLVGLLIGLIVSLLQAVTQVQEPTLTFIPKIVAMVIGVIVLLPWIGQHVVEFARVAFGSGLVK
jgi:flagellar biosynthetic protein FliQ